MTSDDLRFLAFDYATKMGFLKIEAEMIEAADAWDDSIDELTGKLTSATRDMKAALELIMNYPTFDMPATLRHAVHVLSHAIEEANRGA